MRTISGAGRWDDLLEAAGSGPLCQKPSPRNLHPRDQPTAAETLAALQAAVWIASSYYYPGHRPAASALGSVLPTRWAGEKNHILVMSESIRPAALDIDIDKKEA
jgi:hypothetical protein